MSVNFQKHNFTFWRFVRNYDGTAAPPHHDLRDLIRKVWRALFTILGQLSQARFLNTAELLLRMSHLGRLVIRTRKRTRPSYTTQWKRLNCYLQRLRTASWARGWNQATLKRTQHLTGVDVGDSFCSDLSFTRNVLRHWFRDSDLLLWVASCFVSRQLGPVATVWLPGGGSTKTGWHLHLRT